MCVVHVSNLLQTRNHNAELRLRQCPLRFAATQIPIPKIEIYVLNKSSLRALQSACVVSYVLGEPTLHYRLSDQPVALATPLLKPDRSCTWFPVLRI